jgi:hypothetical protein
MILLLRHRSPAQQNLFCCHFVASNWRPENLCKWFGAPDDFLYQVRMLLTHSAGHDWSLCHGGIRERRCLVATCISKLSWAREFEHAYVQTLQSGEERKRTCEVDKHRAHAPVRIHMLLIPLPWGIPEHLQTSSSELSTHQRCANEACSNTFHVTKHWGSQMKVN